MAFGDLRGFGDQALARLRGLDGPYAISDAGDKQALERVDDRALNPVEYWGALNALKQKLALTPSRRDATGSGDEPPSRSATAATTQALQF